MKETSLSTRSLAVYLRFDEAINFKREGKKGRGEEGQIKRLAAYLIFLNQRGHILRLWWEKISTSFQRMTNSFLSWREIVERGNVFHGIKRKETEDSAASAVVGPRWRIAADEAAIIINRGVSGLASL